MHFLFYTVYFTEQIVSWDYSGSPLSVFKNPNLQVYLETMQENRESCNFVTETVQFLHSYAAAAFWI